MELNIKKTIWFIIRFFFILPLLYISLSLFFEFIIVDGLPIDFFTVAIYIFTLIGVYVVVMDLYLIFNKNDKLNLVNKILYFSYFIIGYGFIFVIIFFFISIFN